MDGDKRVLLLVAADGSVLKVLDSNTKQSIPFTTVSEEEVLAQAPTSVTKAYVDRQWSLQETATWCTYKIHTKRFIPLHHCKVERQLPRGCVYMFSPDARPPHDDWYPLDGRYCSGVSMCEIEARIESIGAALTPEFFTTTPDFVHRFSVLAKNLYGPAPEGYGDPPGLTIARTAEALSKFSSPAYQNDSLLRKYNVDPFACWEPRLKRGVDFLGVYSSTWDTVSQDMKDLAFHNPGTIHYYVVVGWTLPFQQTDQLMHVLRANPDGSNWADMCARPEWSRAEKLSQDSRERFIKQFFETCGLTPKSGNDRILHTNSDVFRVVSSSGSRSKDRVVFYSGCAPTQDRAGGVLSMSKNDPTLPLQWFHGPMGSDIGGDSWQQQGSMDGFPTLGPKLSWQEKGFNKSNTKIGAAGYGPDWGRAVLENIALL